MSVPIQPNLKLVHYIRRWSGDKKDESPICGAGPFLLRTILGNTHDSAGHPMNICPACMKIEPARVLVIDDGRGLTNAVLSALSRNAAVIDQQFAEVAPPVEIQPTPAEETLLQIEDYFVNHCGEDNEPLEIGELRDAVEIVWDYLNRRKEANIKQK